MKLWIDGESFSETPIEWGTYRYVQDTELLLTAWAVDDEPWRVLDHTAGDDLLNSDLALAAFEADEVYAHNAMFDRLLYKRHGLDIPIERWRCTMAQALAHSLPGGLDPLCTILQVPQDARKLKIGKDLVRLFCKPRPATAKIRRATRHTHPVEWEQFKVYAGMDIDAMRAVHKRMPAWNYGDVSDLSRFEVSLWHLDQRINERGFAADLDLARAAVQAVDAEQEVLRGRVQEATDNAVQSATERDELLAHILEEYGVALPNMQKATLEKRLADPDIPEGVKELIRIRLEAATTSTSKYNAILRAQVGGRLRTTMQYCGAGRTGRWAGRVFQPHNLPRPKFGAEYIEEAITAVKQGTAGLVYENIMGLTSSALRGSIIAGPGCKLCVADWSNIEGRGLVWHAGEEWKLQAFRDFDLGKGHDLYAIAYAKSFHVTPESVMEDKKRSGNQRQIGKVMELSLGFQGGVGAFVSMAANYKLDIEKMTAVAWPHLPGDLVYEATGFLEWTRKNKRPTFKLSDNAFITCDVFKRGWRRAHPRVESWWADLEDAARNAIDSPGKTIPCRRVKFRRDGAWLRCVLPSGRALCYPQPKLHEGKITYMGVNQYTRQWCRIGTYGGKFAENIDQATARDFLAWAMPRLEARGYPLVLTVHDEPLTETPDEPRYSAGEMIELMQELPWWAEGMPLAAAGYEGPRYKKDD